MLLKVCSIFDVKVGAYSNPFYMRSEGEAIRGFKQVANDPTSDIYKFAEDYILFDLGSFDPMTGSFTLLSAPVPLGKAITLRETQLPLPIV